MSAQSKGDAVDSESGSGYRLAAVVGAILSVAALLIATAALAGGGGGGAASGDTEHGGAAVVAARVDTAQVELGDLFIRPATLEVAANTKVTFTVKNAGQLPHNLKDGDHGTRLLNGGENETVTLGPFAKDTTLICDVPGHEQAGMKLAVKVKGAPAAASDRPAAAAGARNATIQANATPGPNWKSRDPVLAPAPAGTLHRYTFNMTEKVIEVAPGVTQELWTFADQVPGPVLRGKIGDTFEVTIVNRGKLGHSLDFHASKVAWNDEMRTVQPGESLVYRFEAKHAGIFMYHCGTAPALHHIGNGMFGAIIIDPPNLPAVDREFVFVQWDMYLGPEGKPGDLAKMQTDQWDAVVFNGYLNQYLHSPIRIEPGRRYRAWVMDAGPSENSSFHVVGTIFDTVYKEGAYVLRPDSGRGGAQALDLQPSQGGFVEFTTDEPGLYPLVTHKFSNVGKGALGLFQAGEGVPPGGAH